MSSSLSNRCKNERSGFMKDKNMKIIEVKQIEQNPLAKGFYEHMGFEVYKRTECDEQKLVWFCERIFLLIWEKIYTRVIA